MKVEVCSKVGVWGLAVEANIVVIFVRVVCSKIVTIVVNTVGKIEVELSSMVAVLGLVVE